MSDTDGSLLRLLSVFVLCVVYVCVVNALLRGPFPSL